MMCPDSIMISSLNDNTFFSLQTPVQIDQGIEPSNSQSLKPTVASTIIHSSVPSVGLCGLPSCFSVPSLKPSHLPKTLLSLSPNAAPSHYPSVSSIYLLPAGFHSFSIKSTIHITSSGLYGLTPCAVLSSSPSLGPKSSSVPNLMEDYLGSLISRPPVTTLIQIGFIFVLCLYVILLRLLKKTTALFSQNNANSLMWLQHINIIFFMQVTVVVLWAATVYFKY